MSHSSDTVSDERLFELSFNVILRLALAALVIFFCFLILRPFLILTIWALILAVALEGVFEKLCGMVGGRRPVAGPGPEGRRDPQRRCPAGIAPRDEAGTPAAPLGVSGRQRTFTMTQRPSSFAIWRKSTQESASARTTAACPKTSRMWILSRRSTSVCAVLPAVYCTRVSAPMCCSVRWQYRSGRRSQSPPPPACRS